MKKNILCIFALILWVLIVCTILSARIETLMTAEVTTCRPANYSTPVILPIDVLFYDNEQVSMYAVTMGSGWESGRRAVELSSQNFSVNDQRNYAATASYYERYIVYSSKPLRSGDLVNLQSKVSLADDCYLILYPDGAPPLKPSRQGLTLEAQNHDTLLMSAKQVRQPFMEKQVKNRVSAVENLTEYDGTIELNGAKKRIFSLSDVDQFLNSLPLLAVLLDAILISVILWIYSCFLIQNIQKNQRQLSTNSIAFILLTIGILFITDAIHLPASLLPRTHIFEWPHYAEEFTQIFDALNRLQSLPYTAQMLISSTNQRLFAAVGIFFAGLLCPVMKIIIECYTAHRNKQVV